MKSNIVGDFSLGRLVATDAVLAVVPRVEIDLALSRHRRCDWGELDQAGCALNESALSKRERLLSVYASEDAVEFWVITERDRSVTIALLPTDL